MIPAPFWDILGVEETSSEADIRRAYAKKLRVTNPEDDADGFKKLRKAYEHALGYARYMQMRQSENADAEPPAIDDNGQDEVDSEDAQAVSDTFPGDHTLAMPATPGVAHTPPETATHDPLEIERRAHDALCQRLVTLLQENHPAQERLAAFNVLLKSPAIHQLDVFTATEGWLAHLLITCRPASNPLFDPAIAFFEWGDQRVGSRNAAAHHVLYLRERASAELAAEQLLHRLKQKGHDYHKAWKETMLPPSRRGSLNKFFSFWRARRVMEFLHYISKSIVRETLDEEAVAWWVKRAPLAASVRNWASILIFAIVLSPVLFLAMQHQNEISDYYRRPAATPLVNPLSPPAGPGILANDGDVLHEITALETEPVKRRKARTACAEATLRLGKVPPGVKTFATSEADVRCKTILKMTPDSLLMRQYAGIVALRLGEPEVAFDHFDTILTASPDDAYALFGRGLVSTIAPADAPLGKAKDMSDALALNADVARYFDIYGLTAPDLKPSPRKPRSRMPKPSLVNADTPAEKLENPDAMDGDGIADHFGLDNSTTGVVLLACTINAKGRAVGCRIKSEEPANVGLGEVGLLATQDIRYKPATLDGTPVDGFPFNYRLTYNIGPSDKDQTAK